MLPKAYEQDPSQSPSVALLTEGLGRKQHSARILRHGSAIRKSAQPQVVAPLPAPEVALLKNSLEGPPLDWAQAVRVATARLSEKLDAPVGDVHPAIKEMAQELAVFLCAYGKLADEFDRMEARAKNSDKACDRAKFDLRRVDTAGGGQRLNKCRPLGRSKIRPIVGGSRRDAKWPFS